MSKKNYSNSLFVVFFIVVSFQIAHADVATDNADSLDQQAFPFDKQCLAFDKANFSVGPALLDVMTSGDFPQYCVLYSLSNYQVKEKEDDGYFVIGSKPGLKQAELTTVFLKSKIRHQLNQDLMSNGSDISKLGGQWAYFVDTTQLVENGAEKQVFVFQEIDF